MFFLFLYFKMGFLESDMKKRTNIFLVVDTKKNYQQKPLINGRNLIYINLSVAMLNHCNFFIREIIEFVNQPVYFSLRCRRVGIRIRAFLFQNSIN